MTLQECRLRMTVSFQRWFLHLRRRWYFYAIPAAAISVFLHYFSFGFNTTGSMNDKLFIISHGTLPERNKAATFYWQREGFYPKGSKFTKWVVGIPGDRIRVEGKLVYVNDQLVGEAQTFSKRTGIVLKIIQPGVIPEGYYFVKGDHNDSLDSRYQNAGLISKDQFIGRAYAIF